MFRFRHSLGRLALAVTALATGCSTVIPPPLGDFDLARQRDSVALLRVDVGGPVRSEPIAEARFWRMEQPGAEGFVQRWVFSTRPSTGLQGSDAWISVPLPPGRHLVELRAMPGGARTLHTVQIPPHRAAVYIGTFRRSCDPAGAACRLLPADGADAAAAQAVVPEAHRGAFPPAVALAHPYPPTLRDVGLPAPTAPRISVDAASWVAAVDWQAIVQGGAELGVPGGAYTSGSMGDALAAPFGAAVAAGAAAPAAVLLAAVVVLVPIGLIGLAVESERTRRAQAAAAEREARAEELRAAWSPCEATVAAALTPDRVQAHLSASIPAPRERAAQAGQTWHTSVTRVVLRRCGADGFGVEVATRWTAQRPGAAEPAFDAHYSRWVEGAQADRRLRFSERPPWEVPLTPEAACRPLAAWCADCGAALLDQVLQAVTGARDAIAATR